ncbi:50S ribosomal protein L17 [endosymbiont of Pachyrhynchus infernalis]|uniref:50S ribosomal protein L17 n=1 Tax=endosymbiont of Pachyrhynchus infernalis TaxID=1971488 RepID=UPI000DC70AC9|nr:50S ribosomal protein L17 [endosymbiont of Pachyrhynchus infernalis]BBA84857.1 50S ribosomal protein L17 [endosymbiont of Pachyrhynchus infernalis]
MRHKKFGRHLNITRSHYKSMFLNMCNSLIENKIIKTTLDKAKELRHIIEPIINRSKINNLHNRRIILNKLKNKKNVFLLFNKIAPLYINRLGGYTRIIKINNRKGDNSKMSFIELVDKNLLI